MKKEINFQNNQGIYEFKDNADVIFQVNKEDMQFDVKLFYNAFFLDDEYKDIEFINRCEEDKEALRVFKPLGMAIKKLEKAKGWTQEYLAQLATAQGLKSAREIAE